MYNMPPLTGNYKILAGLNSVLVSYGHWSENLCANSFESCGLRQWVRQQIGLRPQGNAGAGAHYAESQPGFKRPEAPVKWGRNWELGQTCQQDPYWTSPSSWLLPRTLKLVYFLECRRNWVKCEFLSEEFGQNSPLSSAIYKLFERMATRPKSDNFEDDFSFGSWLGDLESLFSGWSRNFVFCASLPEVSKRMKEK